MKNSILSSIGMAAVACGVHAAETPRLENLDSRGIYQISNETGVDQARKNPSDVKLEVNWPEFLSKSDPIWTKGVDWRSAPFVGNGMLGAVITQEGDRIHWIIGRHDAYDNAKITIGSLECVPLGKITACHSRLDLWNACVTTTVTTSKGSLKFETFTAATDPVVVISIASSGGERATVNWKPDVQGNTSVINDTHLYVRPLNHKKYSQNPELAVAWREKQEEGTRNFFISVGNYPEYRKASTGDVRTHLTARQEALEAVNAAYESGFKKVYQRHADWWHAFWPNSFVSFNDGRAESFYYVQLYKFASAVRPDAPVMDLGGPWRAGWGGCWWNLNVQVQYLPCYAANLPDYARSMSGWMNRNILVPTQAKTPAPDKLLEVMPLHGSDLAGANVDDWPNEKANIGWACHNVWLLYRHTMDEQVLRDLFPLLKLSINTLINVLYKDVDGKWHMTKTISPESSEPPDANYSLSVLRWGCKTLLWSADKLGIKDPMIPKWKDILDHLVPYPVNEQGFMFGTGVPPDFGHRHFSHMLMVYPLRDLNPDQPEWRPVIEKSLQLWNPADQKIPPPPGMWGHAYKFAAGAAIAATLGQGDGAYQRIQATLDAFWGNTMHIEGADLPTIESPLHVASSMQDLMLQSWGGIIRVFPAPPSALPDMVFHDLRAEGAFLVSAVRKEGKTRLIRVKSLAGEPCRIKTDLAAPVTLSAPSGVSLVKEHDDVYLVTGLQKNDIAILCPGNSKPSLSIAPVPGNNDHANYWGEPKAFGKKANGTQ